MEHVGSKESHCVSENLYFRSLKSTEQKFMCLGGLVPVLEEGGCSLFSLKDKRDTTLFTCVCLQSSWHCQAMTSYRSGWIPWAALGKHLQPAPPGTPQPSSLNQSLHTPPLLYSLSKAHVPTSNTELLSSGGQGHCTTLDLVWVCREKWVWAGQLDLTFSTGNTPG